VNAILQVSTCHSEYDIIFVVCRRNIVVVAINNISKRENRLERYLEHLKVTLKFRKTINLTISMTKTAFQLAKLALYCFIVLGETKVYITFTMSV
jgi:hypothetical protein